MTAGGHGEAAGCARRHSANRRLLAPFLDALREPGPDPAELLPIADRLFRNRAPVHLAHPFETLDGAEELLGTAFAPLIRALPDLERRDTIVIEGADADGADWVGCCGYYTGVFQRPWLDIPPTGHQIAMRFHEFFRIEDGKVAEMQALWDIPEVMMQSGAWPLSPSLGREWQVPGPATQDGVMKPAAEESVPSRDADSSVKLVGDMLAHLGHFAKGGVAAMRLERFWHPHCSWYGPAGIGTCRGVAGFRNWHQIPFLNAMPDRVGSLGKGHLFGEGAYVGFTAWPGMRMSISGDGWLGIAPAGQRLTMRSLDFWRVQDGLIRENWVLVDLLHVYHQIGVDVLARMRELTRARRWASGGMEPGALLP